MLFTFSSHYHYHHRIFVLLLFTKRKANVCIYKRRKYRLLYSVSIFPFSVLTFFFFSQTLFLLAFQCLPPSSSTAAPLFSIPFLCLLHFSLLYFNETSVFFMYSFLFPFSSIHGFASLHLFSLPRSRLALSPLSCLFLL